MGVRSFPMVWITLRPHTQSPMQMPTPPYRSSQIGVGEFDSTEPLSYRSQRATSGPIALLAIKKTNVNDANEKHIHQLLKRKKKRLCLPNIVTTMGKGAKAGCEYLQELKQR